MRRQSAPEVVDKVLATPPAHEISPFRGDPRGPEAGEAEAKAANMLSPRDKAWSHAVLPAGRETPLAR